MDGQSGRPNVNGTLGIPYFAYMMSVISDLINGKMDQLRKLIERNTTKMVPCYFIPIIYTIVGFIFLIVVPSIIFTIMEGIFGLFGRFRVYMTLFQDWDIVDAVYYSFISLSTIGFGDFVPRNDPPTKYADYVRNDTACFEELINPIPSKNVDLQSGLTKLCNPVSSIAISVTFSGNQLFRGISCFEESAISGNQLFRGISYLLRQFGRRKLKQYSICIEWVYSFGFLLDWFGWEE